MLLLGPLKKALDGRDNTRGFLDSVPSECISYCTLEGSGIREHVFYKVSYERNVVDFREGSCISKGLP